MFNPVSTYRFQFHKEFTFEDFEKIIPYLQKLGVGTVYASPIFHSSPGSTHGYDGINPHKINPEIGTEEQLKTLGHDLQDKGISWLQDIVPNHMAFHPENLWLTDVLEKGQQSLYASFFDIQWSNQSAPGKIMVPFLGSALEEIIKQRELKLDYQSGRFVFNYYDSVYPLTPRSYETVLAESGTSVQSVQQLLGQMQALHQIEDPEVYGKQWDEFLLQLSSLMKNEEVATEIKGTFEKLNGDADALHSIAEEQNYRLCHWQETDSKINFRRFFTVNSLICLNIQDARVFDQFHKYIKELSEQGIFQGLRIDHIDGLYDPAKYLEDLREMAGEESYIVVEKILEPGEDLPKTWPIQGNTGYDFLSLVNNLLSNNRNEKAFNKFYDKLIGDHKSVQQQIHDKKAYILKEHMGGELENMYQLFKDLRLSPDDNDENASQLKETIGEFLVQCPVYRYYGNSLPLVKEEEQAVDEILQRIRKSKPALADSIDRLEDLFLKKPKNADEDFNERVLSLYQRLMQFSGPLMAKGVEDTLMYTYNRFIGHSEVGDSPEAFGLSVEDYHAKMKDRQQNWPLSINATSTHDTKRGEDVRARLNVLTDMPEDWFETVKLWQHLNAGLKLDGAPDTNDEYFIYQNLVGAYAMPGENDDNFRERLSEYLQKALREAKTHSNWTAPNEEYETATKDFIAAILDETKPFWNSFQDFRKKISDAGIVNSLSQVVLKFMCPGVPDIYQGCELWDLSLVDPDNRRPVDYQKRQQWLSEIELSKQGAELVDELWTNRYSGKIKLWLTRLLLNERKQEKDLFEKGEYIPLKIKGQYKDNVIAFARRYQQTWYVVAAPLNVASLAREHKKDVLNLKWKDTRIILPKEAPQVWENILLKTKGKAEGEIFVKDLFEKVPVGILKLKQPHNGRGAGVLLHITSLPSPFGVGDMGPEAYEFAEFLSRAKQKVWQILPLSPTEAEQGYSPYSAISSMAGNTLLISPELLVQEGLLEKKDLKEIQLPVKDKANFEAAEKIKDKLFSKAYVEFKKGKLSSLISAFEEFCSQEAHWLDNYSLYIALKLSHGGKPWYEWPKEFRTMQAEPVQNFATENAELIEKSKFLQFLFIKQWRQLKDHCNTLGIQILGDLPFYVSYDSADVWSHPEIFSLDEEGRQIGTSGVPPDYFNENGQLWGMPVFNWDILRQQGYKWWINRIRKNTELFDMLRLDHFRAFSTYWEVPANEETAKNGQWNEGPASQFFKALEAELGKLPFVAEDLGDIDQPVYDLRDEFNFPGMKVLQFAWGDNLPESIDIPHNYNENFLAYTGTHDNNTTVGWFRQEADKTVKKNIKIYTGIDPDESNIHLILSRLAYASKAKIVILPLQDVVGLDERSRMNTPAVAENNWAWRMKKEIITGKEEKRLKKWVEIFNRG